MLPATDGVSLIRDNWAEARCPVEGGIYFPDDSYVPLAGLMPLLPRRPLGGAGREWVSVRPGRPLAGNADYWVIGGEAVGDGGGFLALVQRDTRALAWLLHSRASEPFRAAAIGRDGIRAFSGAYPGYVEWWIPILAPWMLTAGH